MPRNDYFYTHDRPAHPTLPEDRPRGGPSKPARGGKGWGAIAVVLFVIVLIAAGIALFP